jgi:uncharacterized protein YbaP (TraB family)
MRKSLAKLRLLLLAPALGAAVPAPVAQPVSAKNAEPRPAMWLLEDADTKIYLFGTIHLLPPGFKWRSRAFNDVVTKADELVVETYAAPGTEDVAGFKELLLDRPVPILGRVPEDKRDALASAIAKLEIPANGLDILPTWLSAFVIGIETLLGGMGVDDSDEAPGVEDILEEDFRKAGKPIGSVEDAAEVMRAMNALPNDVQVELLIQAVAEGGANDNEESRNDDRLWVSGQVEGLVLDDLEEIPPAIVDVLVTKRNVAWSEWLEKRLERPGTVLFAVGAGHLVGPNSVQVMLARRELTARRIH